jgi:hypothetical protein
MAFCAIRLACTNPRALTQATKRRAVVAQVAASGLCGRDLRPFSKDLAMTPIKSCYVMARGVIVSRNLPMRKITTYPVLLGVLIALLLAGIIIAIVIWFPWLGEAWERHDSLVQAAFFR